MRTIFLGVVAILVYGVLTTSVQAAVPTPQQNALLVQLQMLVLQLQQQFTQLSSESAAVASSGVLTSSTSVLTCDAFFAKPTSIVSGATSTLYWKTTGAVRVSIDHNVANLLPPNGYVAILPPSATTSYTPNFMLTAFDGNGRSVTCFTKVTITPPPLPVCTSFTVSTTSVTIGDSVKLKWEVANASTITINNGVGTVTGTSTKVTPTQTTTYTLTATNAVGAAVTCSSPKVTLYAAPQCTSFIVNPTSIISGTSTKLSWKTTGAVSALIDNGVGSVATTGSLSVKPTKTTTYTLSLTNKPGTVVSCIAPAVTVTQPPPACDSFTVSSSTLTAGAATTLKWATTNATKVTISNLTGVIPVDGSTSTKPQSNTTYLLTAYNAANATTSCKVSVTVAPSVPDLTFCDAKVTTSAGTLCAVAPSKTDSRTLDNSLPTGTTFLSKSQDAHFGFGYHVIAVPKDWAHVKGTWIHFTGSYGRPYDQNSFETNAIDKYGSSLWLDELMKEGYIVIQLAYDNRYEINGDLCVASTSTKSPATGYYVNNCAGKVREMGLTGIGDGAGVRSDDQYNTIDYRIKALLIYLNAKKMTLPEKFDPTNFDWSKVMVSGHSQGAGQSYYIAQKRKVKGMCMLAGVYDKPDVVNMSANPLYNVADWILAASTTSKTLTSLQRAVIAKTDADYTSFYNTDKLILKLPASQLIVVPAATYHNSYGEVIDGHAAVIADPALATYRAQACFGHL